MSNGNNYEFINVDPRVIQMLGGDEPISDPLGGDMSDDLPSSVLESYNPAKKMSEGFGNQADPVFPSMQTRVEAATADSKTELLKEILQELKEIKVILAGK